MLWIERVCALFCIMRKDSLRQKLASFPLISHVSGKTEMFGLSGFFFFFSPLAVSFFVLILVMLGNINEKLS